MVQIGGAPREVVAPDVLDRMTDAMTHRGPNDRGTYQVDGVALGVRRLSIVDVEGGHQPFSNEAGDVWAIQNGELYNHVDVRDRLVADGHSFTSRCDTEILPHLYEVHGEELAAQLRGKFGLAVWDGRSRRAVVARDRLGVKPLYYAQVGDLVVFASELKSLLASGLVDDALDYEAIDAYLTFGFFPAPSTPLAGVSKLMPGTSLVIDYRGVRVEQYWAYPKPDARAERTPRGDHGGAARGAGGVGSAPPDERRAARSDAERRSRLEPHRRADGAQHERAGEDVLGRIRRGRGEERARRRAARRQCASAPTITSSSSRSRTPRSISPT